MKRWQMMPTVSINIFSSFRFDVRAKIIQLEESSTLILAKYLYIFGGFSEKNAHLCKNYASFRCTDINIVYTIIS